MDADSVKTGKKLVQQPIYKSLAAFSRHYEIRKIYGKEYAKIAPSPEQCAKELKDSIDKSCKSLKFSFTEDIPVSFANGVNYTRLDAHDQAKKHVKANTYHETSLESRAVGKTADHINSSHILGSNSALTHRHQKIITDFLDAIFVNPDIFRINRHYVMTQPLSILFEEVLDEEDSYTKLITSQQFDEIPIEKAQQLYSRIIAAIDAAPVDPSTLANAKNDQKAKLREFFNSRYNCDIASPHNHCDRNSVVDVILNAVWYSIMKEHWVPNYTQYKMVYDDWQWQAIVDHVYDELYNGEVLTHNADEQLREKAKLCSTIPLRHTLETKCPEMLKMIEYTRYNPNIKDDSPIVPFSLPERLNKLL